MSPHFVLFLNLQLFTFVLLLESSIASLNPNFEACKPKTCGHGPNISYPFSINGTQEPFCGNPGFDITCGNNGFPVIGLNHNQYIIREIFYNNHSLRVSNAAFSESSTKQCIAPIHNLTIGRFRVHLASNRKDLFLFYGCDSSALPEGLQEHRIGCSAENKTSSVLGFYGEHQNLSFVSKICRGTMVNATVEDGSPGDEKGGILEKLRKGFVLNWMTSNCSLCESTGGRCGFDRDPDIYAFRCYCPDRVDAVNCDVPGVERTSPKTMVVKATVFAALGAGVLIITIIYCFRRSLWSHKLNGLWKNKSKADRDFKAFLKNHGPLCIRRYSYLDIKKMTNSFTEKLGQGGYGGVYKGKTRDECLVAVKVLNRAKGNGDEFINEVASISRTSHVNIVTLLGFCFEGSKRALVYEFMSNGSLEKFIYGTKTNPTAVDNLLNYEILFQIAVGAARGLEYLHRGCNTRIFHFDIKPHNILLDENFFPKISDFGLAKICPGNESMVSMLTARGTPGYIAPEVFSRNFGVVSHKSDVYSFGMMVLEMVGGRQNINVDVDCTSEIYFPHWIYKRLQLDEELALKNITNESDRERVRKMVIISLWCIQTDPSDRPTMHSVVEMLEGRVETLQIPPKPFLSSPSRSPSHSSTN